MTALAQYLMLSSGFVRLAIGFAAGAVAALSMPPLFVLPALFVGVTVLVWLLDGAERKRSLVGRLFGPAFRIGWAFGLGYFLVSLHWVGVAFFVEPDVTGWIMPFAVFGLVALLSLWTALGCALAHSIWADGGHRILALAGALTVTEWLRGHLFTGFPWNLPGYALTGAEPLLQLASVIGVYGLTFIAVLAAATPALIWPADDAPLTRRLAPLLGAAVVLVAMFGFGLWRLAATPIEDIEGVRLRLVQPNIAQADKWRPDRSDLNFQILLDLSEGRPRTDDQGLNGVSHLIWPESVFSFIVAENPDALARIARLLPSGTMLITGAAREDHAATPDAEGALPTFNSIIAINDVGEIIASYDKLRLVPFGEYVPFGSILSALGLAELVSYQSSFVPGVGTPRPFAPYDTPPVLPLICYEAIFSGDLGPGIDNARWLLNLTNDAWFAGSIGPAQHFQHARLRAVEQGLAMIRVANTGVTASVDPMGRITAVLRSGEAGILDIALSAPVNRTIFARYGSVPLGLILVASFLLTVVGNWVERRERLMI